MVNIEKLGVKQSYIRELFEKMYKELVAAGNMNPTQSDGLQYILDSKELSEKEKILMAFSIQR